MTEVDQVEGVGMNHALAAVRTALVGIDQGASGEEIIAAVKAAVGGEPDVLHTIVQAIDARGGRSLFELDPSTRLPGAWRPLGQIAVPPTSWDRICALGTVSILRPEPLVPPGGQP